MSLYFSLNSYKHELKEYSFDALKKSEAIKYASQYIYYVEDTIPADCQTFDYERWG